MFSEKLSGAYNALEEKYYAVLDFLDDKGVPVYAYNDFLEEKGLPAFPITIALIVLLVAGLYGILFVGNTVNPEISISFSDQFNDSVSGVTVSVKDSSGRIIKSGEKIGNGETLMLQGIALGSEITLVAEKDGFETFEQTLPITRQIITTAIPMEREVSAIVGEVQLIDSETGDPIRSALVTAEWMGTTKSETTDSEGKASFAGIPSNTGILVTIQADGYETVSYNYSFYDGELKEIDLVANSASFTGKSNLVVSVFDEGGNPLDGATVMVWDRSTDTSLDERTISGSEYIFSINKGTSTRLIVLKEGFLRYDSLDYDESRTMRLDDELWPVVLEKGGTRLVVTVFAGLSPLSDATVQLFDLNGNLVDYDLTGFGGTTEFSNLEPKEYYFTAYRQGYLPTRETVNVAGTETASILVEPADNTNSSYVGITVLDAYKAMANNADLIFREKVAGQELPLGIPPQKTDLSGYASIVAKTGTVVLVESQKDMQTGFGEKLVEANKDNQLVIELSKPIDVIELQVIDEAGNPVEGLVTIETVEGVYLFEGGLSEGRVFFDGEGSKDAIVRVETTEGETFSQRVSIEGKELVQVNLGEAATGIAPTITFTGIFDEFDQPTEGMVAGREYWLGFQATWATGLEKGGVHIRLGSDAYAFVDSQEYGITGFEATTPDYFYGKSYQPLPAPGNETADKQNVGMPGEMNKFLELYFDQPENMIAFKVRVRANQLVIAEEAELNFRAWGEAGSRFFRFPQDSELGEELFVETKTSLYASTEQAVVKIFETDADCEEEICGNYFFVNSDGLYVERQNFKAMAGQLYALEINLSSKKPVSVTLNLDTDKADPKIMFTGYDLDDFVDQQTQDPLPADTDISGQGYLELDELLGGEASDNPLGFKQGSETSSLTITGLGISPERSRKVRVYFKGVEEGAAEILMQAVAESIINESFSFQVERNRPLMVTISPREIGVGEDFTINVLNAEDGSPVQEASVQVKDSTGKVVTAITGRGSTRRGLRGEYFVKNNLEPGTYSISVSASGYTSEETEFLISRNDVLQAKSPVKIDILKEAREKTVSLSLHNTADEAVQGLGYEIEKDAAFPDEFGVSVSMPSTVAANQDGIATIRVIVNLDEDSDEDMYGEATLVMHGMVAGNYPTKTESTLQISYNKPLEEGCLYFDKQHLVVRVMGRAGSSATEEFEAENNCGIALTLRPKIEAQQLDPNITVSVSQLRIEKDEVERVRVTVNNGIERMYDLQGRRDFKITFESDQVAKTMPLTVELVNPVMNLSYPPNVSLWMVRTAAQELAYAQSPFQIVNNGAMPVTSFRTAVSPEAYMQGITTGFKPTGITSATLYPGGPLTPQRFVYAQSNKTEALANPGQGYIQFYGRVQGRDFPNMARVQLTVNYSGTKCLEARFVDSSLFSSTEASQGTLERAIKIKNACGESVRLSGNTIPKTISGNTFVVSPPVTIGPGQEQTVKLILMKSQETKRTATLKIPALLINQGQWIESNELNLTLRLGELAATTEGKATQAITLNECETEKPKSIAFPLHSSDCGEGYCDAKQLSEYLVAKADTLIKMVDGKVTRAKNSAENFGNCAPNHYCEFEQMGIISDQFPVFLQLDYMTSDVLELALENSKTELKRYGVVQGSKSNSDIGPIGFDYGNVHLGGNFRGCGKYYVKIIGAVRVDNRMINLDKGTDNFVLSINITQDRVTTEECEHRIENVKNFLPKDEGFTILQNYHAWPGFVKSGSEFGSIAKEFAKQLFGTSDGRYSPTISAMSNKIEIVKGDTGGGLLKVRISKSGDSDQPKTITVHIPDSYNPSNATMTSEIGKAFNTFMKSAFSEGDCWGDDDSGQFIVMKSYKDLDKLYGDLKLDGQKAIRINSQEQCIDLNVSSKAAEKVSFTTDFITHDKKAKAEGIEYVEIRDKSGKTLVKQTANGAGEKLSERREILLKRDEASSSPSGDVYKAEIEFCVKGNEKFPLAVQNLENITVTGYSSLIDRKTSPFKVKIDVCGIHPIELVNKMSSISAGEIDKKEVFYATVGWKGDPNDTITLSDLRIALAVEVAKSKANKAQYVAGQGVPQGQQQEVRSRIANQKMAGILSYFGGCAGATAAVNWMVPTRLVTDIVFNCGLNSILAAKRTAREYGTSAEGVIDTIDTFTKPLYPIIAVLSLKGGAGTFLQTTAVGMPFFLDAMGDKETDLTLQELEAEKTDFVGQLINSGLLGGNMAKAINLGEKSMWVVTESNSEELAKLAVGQLSLSDDLGAAKGVIEKKMVENLTKNFKKAAAARPGARAIDLFDEVTAASTTNLADDLAADLVASMGRDTQGRFLSGFDRTDLGKTYTGAIDDVTRESLQTQSFSNSSFKDLAYDRAITRAGVKPGPNPPAGLPEIRVPERPGTNFDFQDYFRGQREAIEGLDQVKQQQWDDYVNAKRAIWNSEYDDALNAVTKQGIDKTTAALDDLGVKVTPRMEASIRRRFAEEASEQAAVRKIREMKSIQKAVGIAKDKQVAVAKKIMKEIDIEDDFGKMKKFSKVDLKGMKPAQLKETAGKIKNAFRTSWGTMMKNIGLGLAGSVVAQIGGWAAWDIYWEFMGDKAPGDEGSITIDGKEFPSDRALIDRPIINLDELMNFTTYKILVSKNSVGRIRFEFIPVRVTDEKAMKEMEEALKKDPSIEWKGDCKKFGQMPAPKVLGTCSESIIPDEGDGILVTMWKAYYDNEDTIYSLSKAVGVPQYQIMAVVATAPNELVSNMPPNWYLYEEDKKDSWLNEIALLIKGKGIANVYSSSDSKAILERKLKIWEKTRCEIKLRG